MPVATKQFQVLLTNVGDQVEGECWCCRPYWTLKAMLEIILLTQADNFCTTDPPSFPKFMYGGEKISVLGSSQLLTASGQRVVKTLGYLATNNTNGY